MALVYTYYTVHLLDNQTFHTISHLCHSGVMALEYVYLKHYISLCLQAIN
jgi:hypothetical protein